MFTPAFPILPVPASQLLSAKRSEQGHYPNEFSPMSVGRTDVAFCEGVDEEHSQPHQQRERQLRQVPAGEAYAHGGQQEQRIPEEHLPSGQADVRTGRLSPRDGLKEHHRQTAGEMRNIGRDRVVLCDR